MRIEIISFTASGCRLGEKIKEELLASGQEAVCYTKSKHTVALSAMQVAEPLRTWTERAFVRADAILFISACGIAVRSIAPCVKDKKQDPAVLVMDEQGTFVISLLSGHIGGANALTVQIAQITGAQPVVTTATDLNGKFAVDVFAAENNCHISDMKIAKEISAALVHGQQVGFYSDFPHEGEMPPELLPYEEGKQQPEYGIVVSVFRKMQPYRHTLYLTPCILTVGIGCRKGTPVENIRHAVQKAEQECLLSPMAVEQAATIDVKKEEAGLVEYCSERGLVLMVYSAQELSEAEGTFTESEFVRKTVGVGSVCERSAFLASGNGSFIHRKESCGGVTVAFAQRDWRVRFE